MKITKNGYLEVFGIVVVVLALARCGYEFRQGMTAGEASADSITVADSDSLAAPTDTITTRDIVGHAHQDGLMATADAAAGKTARSLDISHGAHPIFSVPRFQTAFPDSQQVHLESAQRWGVAAVANRSDALQRKKELVYVGANPYFYIEPLKNSVPYLVPRAAVLLNDIGRAYYDSLYVKGVPLHKIIVTSVLRTKEDVARLQTHNHNATENSCHLYGTTFDISQNRYQTVFDPRQGPRRQVQNDTLKWVLAEVLRDMREGGRCYVKYEVKQGCFHVTVR